MENKTDKQVRITAENYSAVERLRDKDYHNLNIQWLINFLLKMGIREAEKSGSIQIPANKPK